MKANAQPTDQPTPDTALHAAATAISDAAEREAQGRYLNTSEQAEFSQHQAAARAHGYSDEQIHTHAQTLRPGGAA